MVKKYWLAVTFALGLAAGMLLTRPHPDNVQAVTLPMAQPVSPGSAAEAPPPPPAAPAANREREAAKPPTVPRDAPSRDMPSREPEPSVPEALSSSSVEPIDVGPVFREQFAEAQSHGMKNPLLEFHQDLERETRNDTWAYAAEADIQNSLVADTSMGNFKVDHLECRATLCEVRLSARGKNQSEALSRWQEGMRSHPWGNQLQPRSSSYIGRNEDADILVIFQRGPEKKATKS